MEYTNTKNLNTKFNINSDNTVTLSNNGQYTIFDLEKKIIAALNTYYSNYSSYQRCKYCSNITGTKPTMCNGLSTSCDITEYNNSKNELDKSIAIFNDALGKLKTNDGISQDDYEENYGDIMQQYSNVLKLRNELDLKLKEINQTDDSVYNMYVSSYDSTVYTSIIWSILATSLLYYIFVKL